MTAPPPPGSRVADYARYSSANQDERSTAGQWALLDDHEVKMGWVRTGRFYDEERSGTSTFGRAGFFEMLASADRKEFDVLLVEDTDRASRNAADLHTLIETLEDLEITLCTVHGGVVTDIEAAFKAVQSQQFVKQLAKKVQRGLEYAAKQGRPGGSIAYGYRKVHHVNAKGDPLGGVREIDPDEAEVVRRIFRDLDAGLSTFDIVRALNAEGVKAPRSAKWRANSIAGNARLGFGLARNPIYKGVVHWGKTRTKLKHGKQKVKHKSQDERLIINKPELAIVDVDLFDAVQQRLNVNAGKPAYTHKHVEYVLSRKVVCGQCGSAYNVTSGRFACTGVLEKGVCTNGRRVGREVLEQAVIGNLVEHLAHPDILDACVTEYLLEAERAAAEHAARSAGAELQIASLNQRLANLMLRLTEAQASIYASKLLVQEVDTLGAEKERLEAIMASAPATRTFTLDTAAVAARLRARLPELQSLLASDDREAARAKELLRILIDKVVLTPTPGTEVDGRGAGPLTVTVSGKLQNLLNFTGLEVNRVAKQHTVLSDLFGTAVVGFRFSFGLTPHNPRLDRAIQETPVVARLLDQAVGPVTVEAARQALMEAQPTGPLDRSQANARALARLMYLRRQGLARRLDGHKRWSGWVWCDVPFSDEQWWERAARVAAGETLPRIPRFTAPSGSVVVIGVEPETEDA